eukprot:5427071-Amphidinium_carterae.1
MSCRSLPELLCPGEPEETVEGIPRFMSSSLRLASDRERGPEAGVMCAPVKRGSNRVGVATWFGVKGTIGIVDGHVPLE